MKRYICIFDSILKQYVWNLPVYFQDLSLFMISIINQLTTTNMKFIQMVKTKETQLQASQNKPLSQVEIFEPLSSTPFPEEKMQQLSLADHQKGSGECLKKKKIRKQGRQRGRPSKQDVDILHTKISKQFNNIIYHFSRYLIFLHLIKKQDRKPYVLALTNTQTQWMDEAFRIMDVDVFPGVGQRDKVYLLHPNSLHFIIGYNKINKNTTVYSADKIKYYFLAFLSRRKLLCRQVFTYVSNYWQDIIYLINSAKNNKSKGKNSFQSRQLYMQESEEEEQATREDLEQQLDKDRTIGAYEIACYLKSCCEYYQVGIRVGSDIQ